MKKSDITKLNKKQELIELLISRTAEKNGLSNKKKQPIYDGIYDARKYLESEIKIMWIVKEPYDDFDKKGNPKGGDWYLPWEFFEDPSDFSKVHTFGRKMTYVNYALLNKKEWKVLNKTKDDNEMGYANQHIAYANISKMPGRTVSKDSELYESYAIWKKVLWKQISAYEPDIIIFGNTFKFFEEDFEGQIQKFRKNVLTDSYLYDDQLLISAYHPAATISEEEYAKSIISIVKKWQDYKKDNIETTEQKYALIANIAKFLCENNLTMTGEELAGILNRKCLTTSYGSMYSGGRGTYRMIRSCWDYFNNLNKKKEKQYIENAFVKKDGAYAYL
ncbi:MAG: hypothetical protein IKX70_06240 [Treponema sp.]|nr:hypothetical protein [Treponema sp.]